MLNENIKVLRKSKGLSQQGLADKLNVVRQTVSKWEQGLSVPDSDLLIALSEALETPVSTLLGETVAETGGGHGQSPLGKAGDHQSAIRPEKGFSKRVPPLVPDRILCTSLGRICGFGRGQQPVPGLGFQRSGNCCHWHGPPRL